MISLTKIIDPLAGYISKVKSDSNDRQKDNRHSSFHVNGPAKMLTAEDAKKAAYANRLTSELNEIVSGLQNARDGRLIVDKANGAYEDSITILNEMLSVVSKVQEAEQQQFSLSSDSNDLEAMLTDYQARLQNLVDNNLFNTQKILGGTFQNKTFPLWQGEKSPASISLQSLADSMTSYRSMSAVALAGNVNSSINSTNIAASKDITISGPNGSQTYTQSEGESAGSLSSRINNIKSGSKTTTGVISTARTSVRLGDLTNAGTVSFSIATNKTGSSGETIGSVEISDKTNLTGLKDAINAVSTATNVIASLENNNTDVILKNFDGSNIGISSFSHNVANSKLTASVDRRDNLTDFSLQSESPDYGNTSGFAGGSIKYDMVGNLTATNILLDQDDSVNTRGGQISINDKKIYVGTSGSSIQIGEIDATNDGASGNPLQVNFSSNSRTFSNGEFNSLSNWTSVNQQIKMGIDQLGGLNTPTDSSYPTNNGSPALYDQQSIESGNFSSAISSGALRMSSSGLSVSTGYSVVRGPAVISDNAVTLAAGEEVSFRWKAEGGSDAFDVNAYLVNTANNSFVSLLNQSGSSASASTSWATVTGAPSEGGNFKFAFISGSHDFGGDTNLGSQVYIDDVTVSSVSDDVLEQISDRITFENLNFSASNASYTPQVSVTSVTGDGSSNTDNIDVAASLAGFTMTAGADHEIFATGEVSLLAESSFSIAQEDNASNGTTFYENANETASILLLGNLDGTTSLTEQNAVERISLAISKLTLEKDKNLPVIKSQFDFKDTYNSNYLQSLKFIKNESMNMDNAKSLSERTAEMIIADEIQSLLAEVGNASANDVYELLRST